MSHSLIALVWLAGASPAQATHAQQQLESVLVAIDDQWRMCQSVSADLFMEAQKAGSETTGKYLYLRKGKLQMFREEQRTANYGVGHKNLNPTNWQDMLSVGDGQFVTTSINRMGNPVTYKTKQKAGQAGRGGTGLLNRHKNTHEYSLLPKGEFEGRDTWIIEATPVASGSKQVGKTAYTFDQRSGLLVSMNVYDKVGDIISTTELRNIVIGEKMDEALFTYKARPAEKIIDMTKKK